MKLIQFCVFLTALFFLTVGVGCSTGPEQQPGGEGVPASSAETAEVEKTVRNTITLARQGRQQDALQNVGVESISKYLLGDEYARITSDQREKFQSLIREFVSKRALPQAMTLLKNRDADNIGFEPARKDGSRVYLPSSLPGTDLKVTWVLQKEGRKFVITDFLDHHGESSMQRSRDKQIMPLYEKKGMDGLLETLARAVDRMG